MLNISRTPVGKDLKLDNYSSYRYIAKKKYFNKFNKFVKVFLLAMLVILFLPWTQNISAEGAVTTLKPSQRPQFIQSPIPGRIEQWYVNEGDFVKKGDTILRISEIKSEYFDDKLLERTMTQLDSKLQSADAYGFKITALQNQIEALKNEQKLKYKQAINKLKQAKLKVKSDSIDLVAEVTNIEIAKKRYERVVTLQSEGLKATVDVEEKRLKLRETEAKLISQQNKLLESKNKVINAQIELSRIDATYADKIAKSQSDFYTAKSMEANARGGVAKLENSYSNYSKRTELMIVTAPQDGYINKAIIGGVGESFKEGQSLVSIMPSNYELAVETFVRPIDMPLIHIDERVRVQFDGWPAVVFSGWESISYGTYGAKVVAIENYISANGLYRILLAPDETEQSWPSGIRIGSGAKTIALLKDVPVWYEIWRQLNGFPPDFYKPLEDKKIKLKK